MALHWLAWLPRSKSRAFAALALLSAGLSGCATAPPSAAPMPPVAYAVAATEDRLTRYAPLIVPENTTADYNRLGEVQARAPDDIHIDPDHPAYYAEARDFDTPRGHYTNLIYRIHFTRVPGWRLTHGNNVGLFIIITLNAAGDPLLITTLHTCGCFLAMLPTQHLPAAAYPPQWPATSQTIYGETLTSRLTWTPGARLVVRLRDATHRVMDIGVSNAPAQDFATIPTPLQTLAQLQHLPLPDGGATSFYYPNGYVKQAAKPFETTLMSWWALDFRVGRDKYLGHDTHDGPVFYTSLKPWARDASDLRDFAQFLAYWDWQL